MSTPTSTGTPLAEADVVANLRDLGGLPLVGGGTTRSGVLMRSDAPYAGDDDPLVSGWPPAAVIDLRADAETAISPYPWPADTRVIRYPLFTAARVDGHLAEPPTMAALYNEILDLVPDRLTAVPALLATTGPTLVHCTVGKDRTGVAIAVLLLLAGVERAAVVADYQHTQTALPGIVRRIRTHIDVPDDFDGTHPMMQAPEEAIESVIDRLESEPGGVRGWYLRNGGDQAALDDFVMRLTGVPPQA